MIQRATGYIERFHRSLEEEEVWTPGYQSLEEARKSIALDQAVQSQPASSESKIVALLHF
jgi:hypothetical protein